MFMYQRMSSPRLLLKLAQNVERLERRDGVYIQRTQSLCDLIAADIGKADLIGPDLFLNGKLTLLLYVSFQYFLYSL